MRTRNHDWFDTKAMRPVYGFQVYAGGRMTRKRDDDTPRQRAYEARRLAASGQGVE